MFTLRPYNTYVQETSIPPPNVHFPSSSSLGSPLTTVSMDAMMEFSNNGANFLSDGSEDEDLEDNDLECSDYVLRLDTEEPSEEDNHEIELPESDIDEEAEDDDNDDDDD